MTDPMKGIEVKTDSELLVLTQQLLDYGTVCYLGQRLEGDYRYAKYYKMSDGSPGLTEREMRKFEAVGGLANINPSGEYVRVFLIEIVRTILDVELFYPITPEKKPVFLASQLRKYKVIGEWLAKV